MKKLLLSTCACLMAMGAFAAETVYVKITLKSNSGTSSYVRVSEDADYTDDYNEGADADKMISFSNSKSVILYGVQGEHQCDPVVTNNVDGLKLGFYTNNVDTDYSLSFANFTNTSGRDIKLYDLVTGDVITLSDGVADYAFTVAASQVGRVEIANRFVINYSRTPDEGEFAACHQYGKLTINNNPFTGNIVIKNADGDIVLDEVSTNTPQYIDLSALTTTGHYTVEVMEADGVTVGKTFIISIR